jgi:NADPH:quinone reductase-like Zn-dependent oxidoreductase
MKAAVATHVGQPPVYSDFGEPAATEGYVLIDVSAASLNHVTRARASGKHYSLSDVYPFVVGVDGVGRRKDGSRVYFFWPQAPFGGFAERTLVAEPNCIALPDALDDHMAAAIAIPGMSSWAALTERAHFVAGETVLINGATGASGSLAVQIAGHLGAGRVIATGRHAATLAALESAGADCVISLDQDERALGHALEPHLRAGVDVVLDYLWGASAQTLLIVAAQALPESHSMRFMQIGAIGGAVIELPGAVLRSSAITLLGSGIGSVPMSRLLVAIRKVLHAAVPAKLRTATRDFPLSEIAAHWESTGERARTVFTMQA